MSIDCGSAEIVFIKERNAILSVQRCEINEVSKLWRDGAIQLIRVEVPEKASTNRRDHTSTIESEFN